MRVSIWDGVFLNRASSVMRLSALHPAPSHMGATNAKFVCGQSGKAVLLEQSLDAFTFFRWARHGVPPKAYSVFTVFRGLVLLKPNGEGTGSLRCKPLSQNTE